MKSSIFWNITPCGPLKVYQSFGRTWSLHLQDRRISQARNQCEAATKKSLFFGLKKEATCSFETSVGFQWTAWCYIPEDRTLQVLNSINFQMYMYHRYHHHHHHGLSSWPVPVRSITTALPSPNFLSNVSGSALPTSRN
jgi:hypothetical protein